MGRPAPDALAALNALPRQDVETLLRSCCASPVWAAALAARRPYRSADELLAAAEAELVALGDRDLDDALAGHPRIGERPQGPGGEQSRREQSGVSDAAAGTLAAIAEGNRAYERRFGHVYLVCATGRSAEELLAILRGRLGNDPQEERQVVRQELGKINRIRLGRLLEEVGR